MTASRKFNNIKTALSFRDLVKGDFKDLRSIKGAKSRYKVTYDKEYVKTISISDWDNSKW